MKKLFIIANWKSFKSSQETDEWFRTIAKQSLPQEPEKEKVVIVCPSFTLLAQARMLCRDNTPSFFIGAQNISPFEKGAYTGEVNAEQVKEFGDYTIIGHSERRKHFAETDAMLSQKVLLAKQYGLTPIFCVPDQETTIPKEVDLVAYEPIGAIGSGKPDTPENANDVAAHIKEKNTQVRAVLYGGSVTGDNVAGFTAEEHIHGVLVGGASLDPLKFSQIIIHA